MFHRSPSSASLRPSTPSVNMHTMPPPTMPTVRKQSLSSIPPITPDDHPGSSYFSLTRTTSTSLPPPLTRRPSTTHAPSAAPTSPHALFTHLHETSTKRIATLDYLRRAHEGRVHWFNCLHIPREQQSRAVHHDNKRLWVRAKTYFVLGCSLPGVLELAGTVEPAEYIRGLSQLLLEFEGWAGGRSARAGSVTGVEAAAQGRMAGAVGKLFSRAAGHRRGSDAVEHVTVPTNAAPGGEDLEYVYLVTPQCPFELDYGEVFATLCDTLTEVYGKILEAVGTPASCTPAVSDAFVKADAKIRRLLVQGVVKEWEEAVRTGAKKEVLGVGKEVLAGMM